MASPPRQWHTLVASVRGAVHERMGMPLQDAAGVVGAGTGPEDPILAAVADGHGHPRHFRSGRGADMAIRTAQLVGRRLADPIGSCADQRHVEAVVDEQMIPSVVQHWRDEVAEDLAEDPVEDGWAGSDLLAYGTTLLMAELVGPWLVLVQIGDGDIVVAGPEGSADKPVPDDPSLDGTVTTSLCQVDAQRSFRRSVLDLRQRCVVLVLMASDGFGNSQREIRWHEAVSRDLLGMAEHHDLGWMSGQLPHWVARCASAEGSGDDTSVVLLLAESVFPPLPEDTS